jgi:hypothetical protein
MKSAPSLDALESRSSLYATRAFPVRHFQATRTLKRLLGKDFQFDRLGSELHPKPVNAIPVEHLNSVINEMAFAGNALAQEIVRAMSGMSWVQVFCDAFNIQMDKVDRQAFLMARIFGKATRRTLTDVMQEFGMDESHHFINATKLVYQAAFGMTRGEMLEARNLPASANLRDHLTEKELYRIEFFEDRLIKVLRSKPFEGFSEFYAEAKQLIELIA